MISLRDVVTGFGNRDPLAEVWRRDLRGGGSSAEITGTLPLYYSSRGKPLTDYLISGNAVQDGTTSSVAPVDVVGCGTDTANGFKLPVTVNGVEYPIYLGQVETTRNIKKLVLTGEENWDKGTYAFYSVITGIATYKPVLCSHYQYYKGASSSAPIDSISTCSGVGSAIWIRTQNHGDTTVEQWKSYLAAQYAAGSPVTVWYVLAEPETGIVNEPLMKIGDYADTVSFAQAGVTIPTVSGANVLDMVSTVKPSEVYIKGNGIKPTGYGQLVDNNSVRILDKNNVRILVHGQ